MHCLSVISDRSNALIYSAMRPKNSKPAHNNILNQEHNLLLGHLSGQRPVLHPFINLFYNYIFYLTGLIIILTAQGRLHSISHNLITFLFSNIPIPFFIIDIPERVDGGFE